MKSLFATFLLLLSLTAISQTSNLVFFTENGENFTAFVNGVKQNEAPAPHVKAIGFLGEYAQVRIAFASPEIPEIKQGLMVEPGLESTYIIKRNKKGEMIIRFNGSAPIPPVVVETQVVETQVEVPVTPVQTQPASSSITTTTTTTTTNGVVPASGIGINISDGQGGGVNMNVNLNMGGIQGGIQTGVTQSTTTTTYTESYTEEYVEEDDHQHDSRGHHREEPKFIHPSGCMGPMSDADFNRASQSISAKSFSDDKFTIFTQVLKANCVTVNQVIGFMKLFTYEEDKLEVAKRAYPKTWDQGNYYQVNDGFTYSTSTDELNNYIQSLP